MMEVIITNGTQFGDTYKEASRFTVSVPSDDPAISEILEAAKQAAQPSYIERLKPSFYLMHPVTLQRLNNHKTASDYDLTDGSVLRLMCSVR